MPTKPFWKTTFVNIQGPRKKYGEKGSTSIFVRQRNKFGASRNTFVDFVPKRK